MNSALRYGVIVWLGSLIMPSFTYAQEGAEIVQLVIELLGESDNDIRALAFEQIRLEAKGESATIAFAEQLAGLPAESQVGLLSALADRGDAKALPAVIKLLNSTTDESVTSAAVGAVGSLGNEQQCGRLAGLLSSSSREVQSAARQSLVRLQGDDVAKTIVAEMRRATTPTQVTLIEILAERRALETIPDLLRAATGNKIKVRQAAMTALGKIAGPEHLAGMVQGVLRAQRGAERVAAEKNVMFVCDGISDKEKRAEPLLAAMDRLDRKTRENLLPTLGRVGGLAALREVKAAVSSHNVSLHSAGVIAMSNWPDASISTQLIEIAENGRHPEHRVTALRALIRIAPLPDGRTEAEQLDLLKTAMRMSEGTAEKRLAIKRAAAIRIPETLRFVMPFVDSSTYAEQACETVVELAHHRNLREPNEAEFHAALDKVIATTSNATVIDRANRYKKDQTWVRPKK